jgi:hypothetical protein
VATDHPRADPDPALGQDRADRAAPRRRGRDELGHLLDQEADLVLALVVLVCIVGFTEELMFRGIGLVTFRRMHLTEGKVALYSSVIFGAVHLSNALATGTRRDRPSDRRVLYRLHAVPDTPLGGLAILLWRKRHRIDVEGSPAAQPDPAPRTAGASARPAG